MPNNEHIDAFIADWAATGGSELANTQSFVNGLCALIGVDPPRGSQTDDAANDYVFERRVWQDNGDGTTSFGSTITASSVPSGISRLPRPKPITMQPKRTSIWLHDSNETASGKPGTLQFGIFGLFNARC